MKNRATDGLDEVNRRFDRISGTLAALVLALPLAFLPEDRRSV